MGANTLANAGIPEATVYVIPSEWGNTPVRGDTPGEGAVVNGVTEWANVLNGRDAPSPASKGSEGEVVVTDGVLTDVTVMIETDEAEVEVVATGWSSGGDGSVGGGL